MGIEIIIGVVALLLGQVGGVVFGESELGERRGKLLKGHAVVSSTFVSPW